MAELPEAPSSEQHPLPEAPSSKQHPLLLVPCPKLGPHHHLLDHSKVGHTLDRQVGAPSNSTPTPPPPPTPTPRAYVRPRRKEAPEAVPFEIPWRCIMGHGAWPTNRGDASAGGCYTWIPAAPTPWCWSPAAESARAHDPWRQTR